MSMVLGYSGISTRDIREFSISDIGSGDIFIIGVDTLFGEVEVYSAGTSDGIIALRGEIRSREDGGVLMSL